MQTKSVEAEADVARLAQRGRLNPTTLLGFLRSGQKSRFIAGLARLADVGSDTVRLVVERSDFDALAVVCKAADIDKSMFLTFAVINYGGRDAMNKAAGFGRLYAELSCDTAQRTLRFWRIRCEAGEAIARLVFAVPDAIEGRERNLSKAALAVFGEHLHRLGQRERRVGPFALVAEQVCARLIDACEGHLDYRPADGIVLGVAPCEIVAEGLLGLGQRRGVSRAFGAPRQGGARGRRRSPSEAGSGRLQLPFRSGRGRAPLGPSGRP